MIRIPLLTTIHAPVQHVFDLARSIDAHIASTQATSEQAVAGVTTGLIGLGQQVTWEATHFGVKQRLTVCITQFDRPHVFEDEMISGPFKRMTHRHEFLERNGVTEMRDFLEFKAPFGIFGWIAERLFLKAYMTRFLTRRNTVLKQLAESDEWQQFLPNT